MSADEKNDGDAIEGEVFAYDSSGNHRVRTRACVGDLIEYKVTGSAGSMIGRLLQFAGEQIRVQPLFFRGSGNSLAQARPVMLRNNVVMKVIGNLLAGARQDDLRMVEGVAGYYFYHVSRAGKESRAACGAQTMPTGVPLATWGLKDHLNSRYCGHCAELAGQAGLKLGGALKAPAAPRAPRP